MRKLLLVSIALALAPFAGTAFAASDTGSFDVTAEVDRECTFSYPAGDQIDLDGGQQAVGAFESTCNFDGLETPTNSGLQINFVSEHGGLLNDDNAVDVLVPYTLCITDIANSDVPSGVYCAPSSTVQGTWTYSPDAWKTNANVTDSRPMTVNPTAGLGTVAGTYEDTITINVSY